MSEWVSWGICNGRVQRRHSWWSESAEASVTFNETDLKTQTVLAEMMGLEAAEPACSQISWSYHERHGRRTGSKGTSCVSVLIKTLTEGFSVSLSACLLPHFVFLPLIAVLSCCGSGASTQPCFAMCISLEGPWPRSAAGCHRSAGFPRFWFPTWLAAVGIELSELSPWSEGFVHWPRCWVQL